MKEKSSAAYYLLIFLVSFFAFFANNHIVPADLMESRNLATAQEMVRTGNYLVPTMNGELRLEKPPLPTWIAAGIQHLFPGSLAAQRCGSGLAATVMVLFLYLLTLKLSGSRNIAVTAALVLASCYNPVMMGRTASWDIYCHSFMAGAIYFMVRGIDARCRGVGWMVISGLFMGCSFLSKGPVAFYSLLIPFLVAYSLVIRPRMAGKGVPILILLLTAVATSVWWYVWLYAAHPEAISAVAGKESSAWLSHNVRPLWYYWQFPAEAGIWALFWVTAIVAFFVHRRPGKHRRLYAFSIIWFLTSLLLLSFIPEKKTRYLLPVLIPGSITVAMYFWNLVRNPRTRGDMVFFRLNAAVIVLILFSVPVLIYSQFYQPGLMKLPLFVIITVCFTMLDLAMIRAMMRRRGKPGIRSVFACTVLAMAALEAFCLPAVGSMFINEHRNSIRELADDPRTEGLQFYYEADKHVRIELVYELDRTIRPIQLDDSVLRSGGSALVLISERYASELVDGSGIIVEHLGTFDNNWRKVSHKRHNKDLVRHAAVLRFPENDPHEISRDAE